MPACLHACVRGVLVSFQHSRVLPRRVRKHACMHASVLVTQTWPFNLAYSLVTHDELGPDNVRVSAETLRATTSPASCLPSGTDWQAACEWPPSTHHSFSPFCLSPLPLSPFVL